MTENQDAGTEITWNVTAIDPNSFARALADPSSGLRAAIIKLFLSNRIRRRIAELKKAVGVDE